MSDSRKLLGLLLAGMPRSFCFKLMTIAKPWECKWFSIIMQIKLKIWKSKVWEIDKADCNRNFSF